MSNFGLFFIFPQISYFSACTAVSCKLIGKQFSVFFSAGFLFVFREIKYSKNVQFTSGFLCCSFVEGETKEAYSSDKRTLLFL